MIDFRAKVKEMCKVKDIQQMELAQRLGITRVGLSATLSKNNPQLKSMENIAEALGVSLIELLSIEPDGPQKESLPTQGGVMCCPHCGGKIELFVKAM